MEVAWESTTGARTGRVDRTLFCRGQFAMDSVVSINSQHITKALDLFARGFYAFVEQEMKGAHGDEWFEAAKSSFRADRGQGIVVRSDVIRWDSHALLTVTWDQWNRVFRDCLTQTERSLISELRDFRNRWAHQERFNFDDTYRMLDTVHRLLLAVDSPEAEAVAREKTEVLRARFAREADAALQKAEDNRRKWRDVVVYWLCGLSVMYTMLYAFGTQGIVVCVALGIGFSYLTYQRLTVPPRIYYGAHECGLCGKIIYGVECPYCEPTARHLADTRLTREDSEPISVAPGSELADKPS